jgi:cold shock protein
MAAVFGGAKYSNFFINSPRRRIASFSRLRRSPGCHVPNGDALKVGGLSILRSRPFDGAKGSGFIAPDGGGKDFFVHASALRRSGVIGDLDEGDRVSFEIATDVRGRSQADSIALLHESSSAA